MNKTGSIQDTGNGAAPNASDSRRRGDILRGSIFLTLGALVWGCAFVAQNVSMDHIGPFAFNAIRSVMGSIVLLPLIYFSQHRDKTLMSMTAEQRRERRAREIRIMLIMGAAVFVPTTLQQIGLITTSPGKSGFITAMYVVTVPMLAIVLGRRPGLPVLFGVALSVAGLYLLCVTDSFSIERGDTVTLISVFFWAIQIMCTDHFSKKMNVLKMTSGGFFVCGVLSFICMLLFEHPTRQGIIDCMIPLLYTGIMSTGAGYSLQAAGQKTTPPIVASLIMSLESVFAALAGYVILGDRLTTKELCGCALILAAVVLSQVFPAGRREKDASEVQEDTAEII